MFKRRCLFAFVFTVALFAESNAFMTADFSVLSIPPVHMPPISVSQLSSSENIENSIDQLDIYQTQSLRIANLWSGLFVAKMNGKTNLHGIHLHNICWKTISCLLYDFGTSDGWFSENLRMGNGFINFGDAEAVARFSGPELTYVLLANALVLDAQNRFKSLQDIAATLNAYYGQNIFTQGLIKYPQKYIKDLLASRSGNSIGNSELGTLITPDGNYTLENKFEIIRTRVNSKFNLLFITIDENGRATNIMDNGGRYLLEKPLGKLCGNQMQPVIFTEGKLGDFPPVVTEELRNEVVLYKLNGNYYQDFPEMDPCKEKDKGYVKIISNSIKESHFFPKCKAKQIQFITIPIQASGLRNSDQVLEEEDFSKMEVRFKKPEDIENWTNWFTGLPVEIIKKTKQIIFTNYIGFEIGLDQGYFSVLKESLDSKLGEEDRSPICLNFSSSHGPNRFDIKIPDAYLSGGKLYDWKDNKTIDVFVY